MGMQVGMPLGAGDQRMGMLHCHGFAFCGPAGRRQLSRLKSPLANVKAKLGIVLHSLFCLANLSK